MSFCCTIHHVGMPLFVCSSTVIKYEKRGERDVQSNRPGKLDYCEEDKLRLAEGFTGVGIIHDSGVDCKQITNSQRLVGRSEILCRYR